MTGGHEQLSHVPAGALPAVYAARARVRLAKPARSDELKAAVTEFLVVLSGGLADAGCTLVGHIKGTLAAGDRDGLAFHMTKLGAAPAIRGALPPGVDDAVLTINVIVFGVDEQALPAVVRDAWSRGAGTTVCADWR